MAGTGGPTAFVSEYYDKTTQSAAQPAFGAQPTRPAIYNQPGPPKQTKGKGTIIVSVVLRFLTLLLAAIALVILATSKGTVGVSDVNGNLLRVDVKFSDLGGFKYLFAACCIAAVYSLLMVMLCLISLCVAALANNAIVLWIVFVFDQVLAYVLVSAGAAGANVVLMGKNDENITGYNHLGMSCSDLGLSGFCNKAAASVALAFIAFLFLAFTSVLSSRRLFRR